MAQWQSGRFRTRGRGFESSHRQLLLNIYILFEEKTKIKKKRPRMAPFLKKEYSKQGKCLPFTIMFIFFSLGFFFMGLDIGSIWVLLRVWYLLISCTAIFNSILPSSSYHSFSTCSLRSHSFLLSLFQSGTSLDFSTSHFHVFACSLPLAQTNSLSLSISFIDSLRLLNVPPSMPYLGTWASKF